MSPMYPALYKDTDQMSSERPVQKITFTNYDQRHAVTKYTDYC